MVDRDIGDDVDDEDIVHRTKNQYGGYRRYDLKR